MDRELTGIYYRIQREGKWCSVDISDMTEEEMKETINDMNPVMAKRLCVVLAKKIKAIGDQFNIVAVED